jgi:hypothetical protein
LPTAAGCGFSVYHRSDERQRFTGQHFTGESRNDSHCLPFTTEQTRKDIPMRHIAAIAFVLVAAQFASARSEPPNAAGAQPSPGTGVERRAAANPDELKKRVEEVGFKDVEVVPQMFVVVAKKPDGRGVSMIVDAETLQALQLGDDGPDQGGGDEPNAAPEGTCKGPASQPL